MKEWRHSQGALKWFDSGTPGLTYYDKDQNMVRETVKQRVKEKQVPPDVPVVTRRKGRYIWVSPDATRLGNCGTAGGSALVGFGAFSKPRPGPNFIRRTFFSGSGIGSPS